ncbi:ABC transporter ATP-binding protein [Arthrobacter ramosus]|uniref:ABC transporter ATP-binding protein n=1 Tax=Arthrobacter ramosus TaxID=1672 RepID=A0ABV5XVQ7_ARTRM|nr:ABC transporter ATP-binding protein [Arthrobacter ramosus]
MNTTDTDRTHDTDETTVGSGTKAPVLSVRGLKTWFTTPAGDVRAVDGVTFDVAAGETLGLVGESGSGKSVTANSILRLVPQPGRIVAGEIRLNGKDLKELSPEQLREVRGSDIGMVFQNPMTALNPSFTVGWQLAEALRAHGGPTGREAEARIEQALADVGMPDPARQRASFPHQMSGGMRQRVVIAIGMINSPQLLIADEPTTALDVTIQMQVIALMKRLADERGTALLLITHNMGVVAKMCDRVAVMYAGEIVEQAPVEPLFAEPLHPYTAGLLDSLPRADHVRGKLPTLPGFPPDMANVPSGCRFADRCRFAQDQCRTTHPDLVEIEPGRSTRCLIVQQTGKPVSALIPNEPS